MLLKSNTELARQYIKQKEYNRALQSYRFAELIDKPDDAAFYNEFGVFYDFLGKNIDSKFYYLAIEKYTKAIELNNKESAFYINRSYPYGKLGMQKEALSDDNTAIELNPEDPAGYYNRATLYLNIKNKHLLIILHN